MPETDKKQFMQEKIIGRQKTRRSTVKRVILFCLTAIMFGMIATATFVFARPWMEETWGRGQKKETVQVTIPKDEFVSDITPETMEPETTVPGRISETLSDSSDDTETETDLESESETSPDPEKILDEKIEEKTDERVQKALDEYTFSMEDLQQLYNGLGQLAMQADRGIVKIRSVHQDVDWFENQIEKEGQFSGALIAKTEDELIFLTPLNEMQEEDRLEVFLSSTVSVNGYVKQRDRKMGIAIISVDVHEVSDKELLNLVPIPLGNSWSVSRGDLVIAIGSPVGKVHSSMFGYVTYVEKNVRVTDGTARILYTSMQCDSENGTFLIDKKGQLVGWIADGFGTQDEDNAQTDFSVAFGISDYKGILEKLTNGVSMPYFGIYGQEVPGEMVESGMPAGVYVVQCQNDSPAYFAGIQNGDIIKEIGGVPVRTMKDFQTKLEKLHSEQSIVVKVMRNGRDEFKEISYAVTLGSR